MARTRLSFGWAWIALSLAVAIHVTDEALTDFLSVYNPTVREIRGRLPWLPLPTFTFRVWLTGLILGIVALLILSPLAFRRTRWLTVPAYLFAILMMANGLQHLLGSVYLHRLMPGVYSSPLLLAGSTYLMLSAWNERRLPSRHAEQSIER